jgi:methionyl aminopeptidase
MTVDTEDQLRKLKRIGTIVADCLKHMLGSVEDGISTKDLDDIGRAFLEKHGARSAPELTYQFPGATCISLGGEAAHGIPSASRKVVPDTLINIDVSAELDGFFGDTGASYYYKGTDKQLKSLCKATRGALNAAIRDVRADAPLNAIGKAVEKEARKAGFTIIRNLCSHGVGSALHEDPKEIPCYFNPFDRRRIHDGMVFTIEPFLSTKTRDVRDGDDGWTLLNERGHFSAQYEHSMVATKSGAIVLTLPSDGLPFQPA